MAQQVEAFTTKSGNLSSIPSTHLIEGENSHELSSHMRVPRDLCMYVYTQTGKRKSARTQRAKALMQAWQAVGMPPQHSHSAAGAKDFLDPSQPLSPSPGGHSIVLLQACCFLFTWLLQVGDLLWLQQTGRNRGPSRICLFSLGLGLIACRRDL